jgi:hypothetical protein
VDVSVRRTVGSQAVSLTVDVPQGLTPGATPAPLSVNAQNTSTNAVQVSGLTPGAITTSDPANCKPAWFTLDATRDTFPVSIMPNAARDIGDYRLSFNETTRAGPDGL